MADERPILALDVDGVISLFGFDGPATNAPGRFHLINGMAHCISDDVGARILRLAEPYEVVWATGWEDRANERLPQILGLEGEFPYLTFDGKARFGSSHWKIAPIDRYARNRPLAWIDDCLDESCHAWARERSAPTLLVPTEPFEGLTEELTEDLLRWVDAGYTQL
jgi:hypothetical protein